MEGIRIALAGAVALLCALVFASGAGAAPSFVALAEEEQGGAGGAFILEGTHGYTITVMALQRRSDGQGFVLLFAARRGSSVLYVTRAKVTADEVEADLGPLGEIDFDLVLSGREKKERAPCDADPIEFPAGTYRGTFEFRGEGEFTRASATKARLTLKPFLGIVCPASSRGEGFSPLYPGARLRAFSRGNANRLSLQVNANRPGARVFYEVRTQETRDGIEISRSVEGIVPGGAFAWDPLLRTARLAPHAPFSGSASFHRAAAPANRWTGDLAVDFPGRSDVSLAGAAIRASLAHAHLNP